MTFAAYNTFPALASDLGSIRKCKVRLREIKIALGEIDQAITNGDQHDRAVEADLRLEQNIRSEEIEAREAFLRSEAVSRVDHAAEQSNDVAQGDVQGDIQGDEQVPAGDEIASSGAPSAKRYNLVGRIFSMRKHDSKGTPFVTFRLRTRTGVQSCSASGKAAEAALALRGKKQDAKLFGIYEPRQFTKTDGEVVKYDRFVVFSAKLQETKEEAKAAA